MKHHITGTILAGGRNSRFSGRNKAFLTLGEKRLIDRIYKLFSNLFTEVIIVTNSPHDYLEFDARIVTDIFHLRSSLTGLHTGLFYSSKPFTFFTACDIPFLHGEIVETVVESIEPDVDAVIPETSAGIEPLCAVYSERCLKTMERHIREEKLKIQGVLGNLRVKKVSEKVLREKDPDLLSFFNINRPEDLEKAKEIEKQQYGKNIGTNT